MSPYVGKDGEPITQAEAHAAFADMSQRQIAADTINEHYISTVWLVVDHGWDGQVIPFETMIFSHHEGDCPLDEYQERYPTEAAALAGHDRAIAAVREAKCGR